MIEKLKQALEQSYIEAGGAAIYIDREEAANIFGVLLSVANLLDSPSVKSKGDLADCLSKGMERMIVSTEDVSNVQKAWEGLVDAKV